MVVLTWSRIEAIQERKKVDAQWILFSGKLDADD